MPAGRKKEPPLPRFRAKYVVDPVTECWNWTAGRDKNGYARFVWYDPDGEQRATAHWFAFHTFVTPITGRVRIVHTCGNRACVNPAHLADAATVRAQKPLSYRRQYQKRVRKIAEERARAA